MATVQQPSTFDVAPSAPEGGFRRTLLSWGAIFGGAVAALGIWAMLYALGLAFGLSAINPQDPGSLQGTGIFTGIWGIVTPLIALFIGGFVAGRGTGLIARGSGALHGFVMWGLTVLAGMWLVANIIQAAVSGAAAVGGAAAQVGAKVVGSGQAPEAAKALGIDAEQALGPINKKLRAEGRPEITPQQFQAATKDVIQDAVRTGKLNRETLVQSLATNTALSQQDAQAVAADVEAQVSRQVDEARQSAQTTALQAAETTGKAMWGIFGALFVGMLAAILGGIVGASRFARRSERRVVLQREEREPFVPRREAFP
nr:MAG: hypothetical protein DIU78_22730 [Pseudomonadota bacterium]